MVLFGIAGCVMRKVGLELAPLVLAYVLGPMLDIALRQSLSLSGGNFGIFFARPISAVCLGIVGVLLILQIAHAVRGKGKWTEL